MDKLFALSFLGLLIGFYGAAGNMAYDNTGMLGELESLDMEEEIDVDLFEIPSWTNERGSKILVNVESFGAVGDGVSDNTQVKLHIFAHIWYFRSSN